VYILNADGTTTRREPEYYLNEYHNGSNWARGSRASGSMMETRGQHDIIAGNDGYVYFTPGIGVGLDPGGNAWFTGGNGAVKFDVVAEKFVQYPLPKGWDGFHNGKAIDSKGIFWGATEAGAYRLDPQTKEWKLFPSVTPLGRPYGLTVDAQDNAWFAQIAVDKIGYVNGRTGEVGEVVLAPIDDEPMTPEDRQVNRGWTWNQPLYGKGPRRLRADRNPNGRYVWVAEYFGGRLARIDIHTKAVKEYKLPGAYRYSMPYEPVVDKNGMVWLALANSDYQAKFDPSTEQFTFYPLPTRAHNARNIDVDNKPAVPEVWVPYEAGGKVARIQFRTHPGRVSGSQQK
jgi:streptogramin lyase